MMDYTLRTDSTDIGFSSDVMDELPQPSRSSRKIKMHGSNHSSNKQRKRVSFTKDKQIKITFTQDQQNPPEPPRLDSPMIDLRVRQQINSDVEQFQPPQTFATTSTNTLDIETQSTYFPDNFQQPLAPPIIYTNEF